MMSVLGTVKFTDVNAILRSGQFPAETAGFGVLSVIALLMFFGATGKSAQIPLYIWLPDAMEGPTRFRPDPCGYHGDAASTWWRARRRCSI